MEAVKAHVLVRVGHERMTGAPTMNSSSSSVQIAVTPSASLPTTSTPSTGTQWQSAASLFSALSYVESVGSYSLNPTITNWLFIDTSQVMPSIYERMFPTWLDQAKCRGLPGNLFYAEYQHNNSQVQEARSVCRGTHPDHPGRCPVLEDCLNYAINNGERYGVWGGCSERERRRIKRQRNRQQARDKALASGQVIPLSAPPSDRPEPEGAPGHDQAGYPTPWGRSKALIAAWRRERAGLSPAPIGDQPLRLVSQG